jgi:hypothetical protein
MDATPDALYRQATPRNEAARALPASRSAWSFRGLAADVWKSAKAYQLAILLTFVATFALTPE